MSNDLFDPQPGEYPLAVVARRVLVPVTVKKKPIRVEPLAEPKKLKAVEREETWSEKYDRLFKAMSKGQRELYEMCNDLDMRIHDTKTAIMENDIAEAQLSSKRAQLRLNKLVELLSRKPVRP